MIFIQTYNNSTLIIGMGNIGLRHLESIYESLIFNIIFIYEDHKDTMVKAKKVIEEKFYNNKDCHIIVLNSIDDIEHNEVDYVIISTRSDTRLKYLTRALIFKPKFILLEKILFNKLEHYIIAQKIVNENFDCEIVVNHSRRFNNGYSSLKTKISSVLPISMRVVGGKWNMASNALHFIDIFCYLINNNDYEIDYKKSSLSFIQSKRFDYFEFNGVIYITSGIHQLILISDFNNITLKVSIENDNKIYEINENMNKLRILGDIKVENETTFVCPQSGLTSEIIVESMLGNISKLTSFDIACGIHLIFMKFVSYKAGLKEDEEIMIT